MVVLDAALHVLQLIQHGEHVDELPEGQQVRFRDKVFPALRVAETADFSTETVDGCTLEGRKRSERVRFYCGLAGRGESLLNDDFRSPGST